MDQESSPLRKFVVHFLKYSPSSIVPSIIGFLTLPFLTNFFPPREYGNYVLVMSTVNFLGTIINSMWGPAIVRFFVVFKEEDRLKQYYDTIIGGYLISLLLITIAFIGILELFKTDLDPFLYRLMIFGIFFLISTSYYSITRRLLNAKEKSGLYSIFTVITSILSFLLGISVVIFFKTDISGFILGNIMAYIILFPFMYYTSFEGVFFGKNFQKSTFFNFMDFGFPLLISGFSAWILSISDRYILNFFKGSLEVGIYSASYTLSEYAITIIWTLFITASYPLVVKMWETKGHDDTQKYITHLTRYFILIAFPAALGLSILSKSAITIVTSPSYYEGYIIVPLISFGAFLLGLQWFAQLGIVLNNKTTETAKMVFIAGISNIILNFILIPELGYFGAAISTLIAYMILLVLCVKISNAYLKWILPLDSFVKIIFASLAMGIIVYLTSNLLEINIINLLIEVLMGTVVYLILLFLIGEIKKEEINLIKSYLKKIY